MVERYKTLVFITAIAKAIAKMRIKIRTSVIVDFQTFKVFSSSRRKNEGKGRLGGIAEVPGTDLLPKATIGTRLRGLKKVVLGLIN